MNVEKQYDVVALGELLIDFTSSGMSANGNILFEANPGGAPCNVLSMVKRFGHQVGFIGKVGQDMFGEQLKDTLYELGIETKNLMMDEGHPTTLAFVKTATNGERDFSFYRNYCADIMICEADILQEQTQAMIEQAKIFHFGTLSLTHESNRLATYKAIEIAKESGASISFDPNLRKVLWSDLAEAKKQFTYGFTQCDILKISDEELVWYYEEDNLEKCICNLRKEFPNVQMLLLTSGKEGSKAYYKDYVVEVAGFVREETLDTTGAGDTFFGTCIHFVLEKGLEGFGQEELAKMLRYANMAASIITTKKGALKVMPTKDEIFEALERFQ